jgi:hypothetical protein
MAEAAERMRDDDDIASIGYSLDDGHRVLRPACRLVVAGEVDRDRIVPTLAQHRCD